MKNKAKGLINKLDDTFKKVENKDIFNLDQKNKKKTLKDNNLIINKNFEKQLILIKEEIINFLEMENPSFDVFNDLEFKVKIFIEATHQKIKIEGEKIYWPVSGQLKKNNLSARATIVDECIIWYSEIKYLIDNIIKKKQTKNEFFESILNLYKDTDLEDIINFINDKKKINNENYFFSNEDIEIINNILRGKFINKIAKEGINKDIANYLKNYLKFLNKEINPIEVSQDQYIFINTIANKYPYNLEIIFPFFDYKDVFYLFFKYQNNNNFSKNEIIKDLNIKNKQINLIVSEINKSMNGLSMYQLVEKIILNLYEKAFKKSKDINFLKNNYEKIEEENEKKFVTKMNEYMELFTVLDEIVKNQSNINNFN